MRRAVLVVAAAVIVAGAVALLWQLRPSATGPAPGSVPSPSGEVAAPAVPAPAESRKIGQLHVLVMDPAGGALQGARVEILGEGFHTDAASGPDGTARLTGIPLGPMRVVVSLPGWTPARVDARLAEDGQLEVRLARAASLEIAVRDGEGPVESAVVQVRSAGGAEPASALTDAAGRVRLDDLAPGLVHVRVDAAGHAGAWEETTLAEGVRERLEIVLEPSMAVAGQVVDPAGRPVAGAEVEARAFADDGEAELATVSAADGSFALAALPQGSWALVARAAGFGASEPEEVDRAESKVALRLRPAASVRGRVVVAGGEPARDLTALGRRQPDGEMMVGDLPPGPTRITLAARDVPRRELLVELREGEQKDLGTVVLGEGGRIEGRLLGPRDEPVDATVQIPGVGATRGTAGAFAIAGVPPGRHFLRADAISAAPLAMATAEVEVKEGEVARVDLVFESGAHIKVRALAAPGTPAPDAAVVFVDGRDGAELLRTRTGPDGKARSTPLAAGPYQVLVELGGRREVHAVALGPMDEELVAGPPGAGAILSGTVAPAGARLASVLVAPGAVAAPRSGEELLALMRLPDLLVGPMPRHATRFSIPGVPPGPHTLVVLLEGAARNQVRAAAVAVAVPEGGEVEVAVEVPTDFTSFDLPGGP